jgi:hypothetical protein
MVHANVLIDRPAELGNCCGQPDESPKRVIKPAAQGVALALDPEQHRLFAAGRNPTTLVIMDATDGKVLESFPISAGVDGNIYDPATDLVFSSTRAGVLHVFHAALSPFPTSSCYIIAGWLPRELKVLQVIAPLLERSHGRPGQ